MRLKGRKNFDNLRVANDFLCKAAEDVKWNSRGAALGREGKDHQALKERHKSRVSLSSPQFMNDLPIACTLTSSELQERRRTVLEKLRRAVLEVRELEDGYAYCFPSEGEWLPELAAMIDLERQCCPFLRFRLTVEANGGPVWMELTGPEGTKDFLTNTFD